MKRADFSDHPYVIGQVIYRAARARLRWKFGLSIRPGEVFVSVFYPAHLEEEVYSWYADAETDFYRLMAMMQQPGEIDRELLDKLPRTSLN